MYNESIVSLNGGKMEFSPIGSARLETSHSVSIEKGVGSEKKERKISEQSKSIKQHSVSQTSSLQPKKYVNGCESKSSYKLDSVAIEKFRAVARDKGMSKERADVYLSFISEHFDEWTQGPDFTIEMEEHTFEYLSASQSVVIHFFVKPLGRGRFSTVYPSFELLTGQSMANKVSPYSTTVNREGTINMEFNDAEHVRGCHRVNDKGLLLEGMRANLSAILAQGGLKTEEEKIAFAKGIARGMAEVHAKGYVHQDLHGGNCFVSYDGVWKVGDLGTAQKADQINSMPTNLSIASPNRIRGELFKIQNLTDFADDIWSLGIVFYELEHGVPPPFASSDLVDLLVSSARELNECLAEIRQLPKEEQRLIFSWNGKGEFPIPEGMGERGKRLEQLAMDHAKRREEVRNAYQKYHSLVTAFMIDYQPTTSFEQIVKLMLIPEETARISEKKLLEAIDNLTIEDFIPIHERAISAAPPGKESTFEEPSSSYIIGGGNEPVKDGYVIGDAPPVKNNYIVDDKPPVKKDYIIGDKTHLSEKFLQEPKEDEVKSGYIEHTFNEDEESQKLRGSEQKTDSPAIQEKLSKEVEIISERTIAKALIENNLPKLKEYLDRGCDIAGWRNGKGETLLHLACRRSSKQYGEMMQFLLTIGADPNAVNDLGETPLHLCAKESDIRAGLLLLGAGANPEALDKSGMSPIAIAERNGVHYVDENKLLVAKMFEGMVANEPIFVEWFKNQAAMLQFLEEGSGASKEAKHQLMLLSLHAFSKAASYGPNRARRNRMQISPLLLEEHRYHRNPYDLNTFTKAAEKAVAKKIQLNQSEIRLVHSPLVREIFVREFSDTGELIEISSEKDIDALAARLSQEVKPGSSPPHLIVDFSKFMEKSGSVKENHEKFAALWQRYSILTHYNITPIALLNHQGHTVLSIPFNQNFHKRNIQSSHSIDLMLSKSGFLHSPDEIKEILVENQDLSSIFGQMGVAEAAFTTGISSVMPPSIPKVYANINQLLMTNAAREFENYGRIANAPPYLRILSEGTLNALRGLEERKVEEAFKQAGIEDLLQLSYYKIINAMGNANHKRENLTAYCNEIEIIHQEIQNILAILSIDHGYSPTDFGEIVSKKFTSGSDPIIPEDLGSPLITINPSAMHCLASTLGAVEAQKGSKSLNVAMMKDVYYEADDTLKHSNHYQIATLDGDLFTSDKQSAGFREAPKGPVDLFICEFHHNISVGRTEYHKEEIAEQILAMKNKGYLAKPCTVVIDMTIDLELSPDMRELLNNPEIKKMIQEGELNMVFLRSGQKFDMLGLDNYYGGITATVNNGKDFAAFNHRMQLQEDQLGGLSYQGMVHLQKYAGDSTEKYRQGLMDNTQLFYNSLPEAMKAVEGNRNPLQVSLIHDERLVYIDMKSLYQDKEFAKLISARLKHLAMDAKLPLISRPSFGFPITNFTNIVRVGIRINPGLEKEEDIKKFAGLFNIIQKELEEFTKEYEALHPGKSSDGKEAHDFIMNKIETLIHQRIGANRAKRSVKK